MVKIYALEKQSGILRLLVFLSDHDGHMLSDIWDDAEIGINQGYKALEKARDLGLTTTKIDNKKYPPRNFVFLTDKGRKVAKHLKEIEEILGGEKHEQERNRI